MPVLCGMLHGWVCLEVHVCACLTEIARENAKKCHPGWSRWIKALTVYYYGYHDYHHYYYYYYYD